MFRGTPVLFLWFVMFVGCGTYRMSEKIDETRMVKKSGEVRDHVRYEIARLAKKQLGTKYKYAGKSPKTGFDCSGFTHYVLKNHGVNVSGSSAAQAEQGKKINLKNARPGDLVFFKRGGKGRVFHVAMIYENKTGSPKVIHSTSSRGVVIDDLLQSSYWEPKVWQVRNVVD